MREHAQNVKGFSRRTGVQARVALLTNVPLRATMGGVEISKRYRFADFM